MFSLDQANLAELMNMTIMKRPSIKKCRGRHHHYLDTQPWRLGTPLSYPGRLWRVCIPGEWCKSCPSGLVICHIRSRTDYTLEPEASPQLSGTARYPPNGWSTGPTWGDWRACCTGNGPEVRLGHLAIDGYHPDMAWSSSSLAAC